MGWRDDWRGVALGIAFAVLAVAGIAFIVYLYEEEYSPREGVGSVRSRDFVPAHATTSIILVGKVPVPTEVDHPDSWQVTLEVEGQLVEVGVTKDFYEWVQLGMYLEIVYAKSLVGNRILITEIR